MANEYYKPVMASIGNSSAPVVHRTQVDKQVVDIFVVVDKPVVVDKQVGRLVVVDKQAGKFVPDMDLHNNLNYLK